MYREVITKNAAETQEIGTGTWTLIKNDFQKFQKYYIFLYGDLGSGKSTFTRGFAQGLGIVGRIISPTFLIIKSYQVDSIQAQFLHADLYRVKHTSDQESLGLSEIFLQNRTILLVEWAQNYKAVKPDPHMDIYFRTLPDGLHEIRITQN